MIDLSGRVAIVTGAGGGLGRAHARLLAQRGARVVVNDLGQGAQTVAREIVEDGGAALAILGSVADAGRVQEMVDEALATWGRVDILVNNAGVLRDKSFAKMSLEDFRLVVDVHLMGAVNCTKAVWETMRRQTYGRIVMTTSSSGSTAISARPITAPRNWPWSASCRPWPSRAPATISASTASRRPRPPR